MFNEFKIRKIGRQKIVTEKSWMYFFTNIVRWLVSMTFWYGTLIVWRNPSLLPTAGITGKPLSNSIFWMGILLPLFILPFAIYKVIGVLRNPELIFDGATQGIYKASQKVANFADVESVDIKKLKVNSETEFTYQLAVYLKSAPPIVVGTGSNYNVIFGAATDLSNALQVNITKNFNEKKFSILDWTGPATEPKIQLEYTPKALSQALGWGLSDAYTSYTHQDIAEWCDNFYCEYLDGNAPPDIERIIPVLTDIREQWDALLERQPQTTNSNPVPPTNARFSHTQLNKWLDQIKT